jgi:hypothetical protein
MTSQEQTKLNKTFPGGAYQPKGAKTKPAGTAKGK